MNLTTLRRIPLRTVWYVVALVPFVTAAVRALADDWFPIGDGAQLYIRATDVLTVNHPWLGSGTSASVALGYQVNNAGPLYFDVIAPFARTLPKGPGNVIGVTVVNAACLVLAALAARRIGGRAYEGWVLAAGAVLAWTLGSELLFDMFQAHALLFPFLAACVLFTGVARGQRWVWPWLVGVVTLIAQTHLSYAYVLVVVSATAVGLGVAGLPSPRRDSLRAAVTDASARRTWWATGAVLAVTWFQPVWQQLFGPGDGNLVRLVRSAGGTEVAVGFANAVKLVAAFVSLPPWAGRQGFAGTLEPSGLSADGSRVVVVGMPAGWLAVTALGVTLVLLAGAWWWAGRRGLDVLRTLAVFAGVVLVGSVLALSRLTVSGLGLAPHHTRWLFVVALLVYVVLAWALCDLVAWRVSGRTPVEVALVVATTVIVVASVANLPRYSQRHGPTATTDGMPALRTTFAAIDAMVDAGTWPEPVFYDVSNERIYAPYSSAIQLHLRERGAEFRIEPEFLVRQLGEHRRADGSEVATIMQFQAWEAYFPPPGCVVSRTTGDAELDAAHERTAEELAAAVAEAVAGGGFSFAVPPDAAPLDVELAERATTDPDTLHEVTLDGRLRYWLEQGWIVVGPDALDLAERVRTEGPALTAWLERLFALVITDPVTCA